MFKKFKVNMSSGYSNNTVIINGKSISVEGSNISVVNDKVYVDGKLIEEGLSGIVTIEFKGDLATLDSNGSIAVNGNVEGDVDAGGSVTISGDVEGDVDSGGSVTCGSIKGNVDAGGSVRINN